jgi:hypothetical protein
MKKPLGIEPAAHLSPGLGGPHGRIAKSSGDHSVKSQTAPAALSDKVFIR